MNVLLKDVNKQWQILFMNLDMIDRNSTPEKSACIWQSKRVGIIKIEHEKNMNSLFHATFSWLSAVVVSFKNSLVFTQDAWPMQAWIPVVSSSLYFWKSVFSFRADSILKSDGDFISNGKFTDCVHFFDTWARQVVIETIAVVYSFSSSMSKCRGSRLAGRGRGYGCGCG